MRGDGSTKDVTVVVAMSSSNNDDIDDTDETNGLMIGSGLTTMNDDYR